ncbi:hypothetical protein [Mesorhizobium sp. CAU 1741]|uniref:hypothetical protein n=1 Tax=Mesorhizobium sp. CAU 1741 TaxID=3140366 RepID=UPI00325A6738
MSYASHLLTVRNAGREGANKTFALRHNYDTFEEMCAAGRGECERVLTAASCSHSHKQVIRKAFVKNGLAGFDARMKELRHKWDEQEDE